MYKAVVFDMDGTLVDSPLCFDSIRRQLEIPEGKYILEHLEKLDPDLKEKKQRRLQEIELAAARKAVPFPGVLNLLNELRAAHVKIGIFTRNCSLATRHVVESHGLNVDMIVTREDAPAKPDPEGLMRFLSCWELRNEELLFVGDFRFDIECGKKAGVRTALFTNGQAAAQWNPDHVISDYRSFKFALTQV